MLLSEGASEVVGIDTLNTVGSRYPNPLITYRQMDGADLAFDDETFDLSYSIATLEHCPDPLAVIREMLRVTKKGGACYIQAGPLYFPPPFGHHMFGFFDDYPWIHLRLSKEQIVDWCKNRGVDRDMEQQMGMSCKDYIFGMINKNHINGLSLAEYGLDDVMKRHDVRILSFSQTRRGEDLLDQQIRDELRHIPDEVLMQHGFDLILVKKETG